MSLKRLEEGVGNTKPLVGPFSCPETRSLLDKRLRERNVALDKDSRLVDPMPLSGQGKEEDTVGSKPSAGSARKES